MLRNDIVSSTENWQQKRFYESIKYCQISIDDIDFYEKKFPKEEYLNLLAISSFNSSGYIREKAAQEN